MNNYSFTEKQAEAIVSLQLYRLTNTDVNQLLSEKKQLEANILDYLDIINNKNRLEAVIVKEFEDVKKEFGSARRTQIVEQYKK